MVAFLVCCVALAISAMYEVDRVVGRAGNGRGADDFLGTRATSGTRNPICSARFACINDGNIPRSLSLPSATAL